MSNIILQQISADELVDRTAEKVMEKLKDYFPKENGSTEFITRRECCALLKMSLPTLSLYCKKGLIPCYRIGSSIRFKKNEIEQIVNNGLRFKHSR
jgi:excisionase family DNA binding protein